MIKVIIAGSRTFDNYELLSQECNKILESYEEIEIVSGNQKSYNRETKKYYGADYLGELYAFEKKYSIALFPADWKTHGKKAGPLRNKQMANYADMLIAFWDGQSKGTKNMIEEANKAGLLIHVIKTPIEAF